MSICAREKFLWDSAIAKRATVGKVLPPKQKEKYDQWFNCPYRKLCFDKEAKVNVPSPSLLSPARAKDCFVVELKLSLEPAHLSIRFGSSQFYHLFVRKFQVAGGREKGWQAVMDPWASVSVFC